MNSLTYLFSAEHMEAQADAIHASYEDEYKRQEEDHLIYLSTLYTRAKQFPSALMSGHDHDQWLELRKSEDPSLEVVVWLENELKFWIAQTDDFKSSINQWANIPSQEHGTMLRIAIIAEKKLIEDKAWKELE